MIRGIPIIPLIGIALLLLSLILLMLAIVLRSKRKKLMLAFVVTGIITLIIYGSSTIISMFGGIKTGLKQGVKGMSLVLEREVLKIESSENISEEDMSVIKELTNFATAKETSTWGIYVDALVTRNAIKDGKVNEQERNNMILVRDLLRENQGRLSVSALTSFERKYPAIREIIKKESEDKEAWEGPRSEIKKWLDELEIPTYPEAYDIVRKPGKPINYKKVDYKVNAKYRSNEIFDFYNRFFKENGWEDCYKGGSLARRVWNEFTYERDDSHKFCSFSADWIEPTGMYIIHLNISYTKLMEEIEFPDRAKVICAIIPSWTYPEGANQ